jgi:putative hydrolase of the HAD superfamily
MIESAMEISNGRVSLNVLDKIIGIGKTMINHPVELLDGVEEVLKTLSPKYHVMVVTKGDLLDQERKLEKSGLAQYFHHVEVLSEKKETNYSNLLEHLRIPAEKFLMIGNSLKSDVLPIVNIGAKAIHIPFHTTWQHEMVQGDHASDTYLSLDSIRGVLKYL